MFKVTPEYRRYPKGNLKFSKTKVYGEIVLVKNLILFIFFFSRKYHFFGMRLFLWLFWGVTLGLSILLAYCPTKYGYFTEISHIFGCL